jgi:hypothetical protein
LVEEGLVKNETLGIRFGLTARFARPKRCLDGVVGSRYHSDKYGTDQDEVDVLRNDVGEPRDVPEQEPAERETGTPDECTDEVIERILAVVHVADTGGNRRERANDGNEPRDDDRETAEALKEVVGAHHVRCAEEAAVFSLEHAWPELVTNEVPDFTAEERRDTDRETDDVDRNVDSFGFRRHRAGEGEKPRNDEQGVTRKHEPDKQACLGEDDETHGHESPWSEGLDDDGRVEPRDQRKVVDGVSFVDDREGSGVVTGY